MSDSQQGLIRRDSADDTQKENVHLIRHKSPFVHGKTNYITYCDESYDGTGIPRLTRNKTYTTCEICLKALVEMTSY